MKEIRHTTDPELLTEEERQERIRQRYRSQLKTIETVRAFMLMGYSQKDIYDAMRSLHFIISEDQIEFYCNFIEGHTGQTIQEINDDLWRFLWEIEPPALPEPEPKPKKPDTRKPVEEYLCRIVILNLLKDRVEYLISVLNAGCFEMVHFINAGYDTHYVETMKTIIEKNPEMHSRDVAKEVYRILYQDEKHEDGVLFSIDKIDFIGMFEACREKWQNGRKKIENGGKRDE